MRRVKISEIIKILKSILYRLIDLDVCNNEEVLRVSHRLDRYIVIKQILT